MGGWVGDQIDNTVGGVLGGATDMVVDTFKPLSPNSDATAGATTDAIPMPSYSMDTEAAKRRKRALALQRGLMSTTRNRGTAEDSASTLTPTLQGKQKLGQ